MIDNEALIYFTQQHMIKLLLFQQNGGNTTIYDWLHKLSSELLFTNETFNNSNRTL